VNHYKLICKTVLHTIEESKISYCNNKVTMSENKIKTTWNIVKSITSRRKVHEELQTLMIDGKLIKDCQIISNSLNDCFISTAIRVNDRKLNIWNLDINHPMEYLHQTLKKPFLIIKFKYTSIKKFKKTITPLKTF